MLFKSAKQSPELSRKNSTIAMHYLESAEKAKNLRDIRQLGLQATLSLSELLKKQRGNSMNKM